MKIITAKEFCELIEVVKNEYPRAKYWEEKTSSYWAMNSSEHSFSGYGPSEPEEIIIREEYLNLSKLLTSKGYESAIFPLTFANLKLSTENCRNQFLQDQYTDELYNQLVWCLVKARTSHKFKVEFDFTCFEQILDKIPQKYLDQLYQLKEIDVSFANKIESAYKRRKASVKNEVDVKSTADIQKAEQTEGKITESKKANSSSKIPLNSMSLTGNNSPSPTPILERKKSADVPVLLKRVTDPMPVNLKKEKETPTSGKSEKSVADLVTDKQINDIEKKLPISMSLNPYQDRIVRKTGEKEGKKISMYGFPTKDKGRKQEVDWLKQTVSRFFRVGRPLQPTKASHKIYIAIQESLAAEMNKPINITNLCRRSFIIALSKILSEQKHMPALEFKLGITNIKFIPSGEDGTKRQKGNFKMEVVDCFDLKYGEGCIKRITYLCETQWDDDTDKSLRRMKLRELFQKKLQTLSPFVYTDLNKYGNILIVSDRSDANPRDAKIISNINFLNGLLFLVSIVEVLVRLYRSTEGNVFPYSSQEAIMSDSFPVAIAQARSLILLLNGEIKFNDFFGETDRAGYDKKAHRAYFGAVTGIGTIDHIDIMLEKLFTINEHYNQFISESVFCCDFKKNYLDSNKDGYLVEGRSKMYFALKAVYGSGSESDDETSGYSSAEDNPEVLVYKS